MQDRKQKPAWAYTEEKYNEVEEDRKEEELEDLLSFAENLDYGPKLFPSFLFFLSMNPSNLTIFCNIQKYCRKICC
jgi:hypothetical protein